MRDMASQVRTGSEATGSIEFIEFIEFVEFVENLVGSSIGAKGDPLAMNAAFKS